MFNTIEECKNNSKLKYVKDLFNNTKIHGGFCEYKIDENCADSGVYIVASVKSMKNMDLANLNLGKIQRKIEGDEYYFYPFEFAVKVTDEDPMVVFNKVAEFCKKAELVNIYFSLQDVKIPDRIAEEDIAFMKAFIENGRNHSVANDIQSYSNFAVRDFVRNYYKETEAPKKYKNKQEEIFDYIRKYKNVSMHQIKEDCMPTFIEYLAKRDINLEYVVSDPMVFDIGVPDIADDEYNPYGVLPPKTEYREIYFKSGDGDIIQSALNYINITQACQHASLDVIALAGEVSCIKIPYNFIYDFDAYCDGVKVEYTIDDGYYDKPDKDAVPVIFATKDKEIVEAILTEICSVESREHFVPMHERCLYTDKLNEEKKNLTDKINKANENKKEEEKPKRPSFWKRGLEFAR